MMNKSILALPLLLALLGCAPEIRRMDVQDLCTMRMDCANKDAQIRFAESQMSTQNDRIISTFTLSSVVGLINSQAAGTYEQHRAIAAREYDVCAKKLIWDLRTNCPDPAQQNGKFYPDSTSRTQDLRTK